MAIGGGSGIRTHVTVSRKHAFQACAFSHSATPPDRDLLHRPRLFTSKRNARLRVQAAFLTGHRKGRALRKAGQAPAARIDLRRRRRNCPAGGAHYSHRRTTDNRPHLANPASLISIIMFYFQRLTLMCVAAQNKHKCGRIRGAYQLLLVRVSMTGEASALHQVLTGGPTLFAIVRLNANDSNA